MSGPIVRLGTTPEFWKNWDSVFGDKKKGTAATKTAAKKTVKTEKAPVKSTKAKAAPAKKKKK